MLEEISITQFAKAVGLSDRTIYRYIETGQLTPQRKPGIPYFTKEDLDKFLEGQKK